MPIVLAIEPDRRQAAHITAIVRQQVGAELVLADTTEGALDAIGNRVPDLVLVPALLSPQDDSALAAALRVIAAAAHVRTLTIPVLASGTKRAAVGGMLAKWRRNRAASPEPDGCDPAVFGEQISTYLKEAAEERERLADDLMDEEPFSSPTPFTREPEITIEPEAVSFHSQPFEAVAPLAFEPLAVEPPAVEPPALQFETQPFATFAAQPFDAEPLPGEGLDDAGSDADPDAFEIDEGPTVDLSGELEGLSESGEEGGELFDGEPVGVYTLGADDEPTTGVPAFTESLLSQPALDTLTAGDLALDEFDQLGALLEAAPLERTLTVMAVDEADTMIFDALDALAAEETAPPVEAAVVAPAAAVVEPVLARTAAAEPLAPMETPRADIEPWEPMYLTPGCLWPALEGVPAEMPVARTEQPDWIELVASLRQDIERRRTEPAATPRPIAARPSDGAKAEAHRLVKKPRQAPHKTAPVQDEWGFFDPEQCGFSTLLAKLEEITDDVRT